MKPIRLLPSPTEPLPKDPAKAVERVKYYDRHEITPETLTIILNLAGIKVKEFTIEMRGEEKVIHLFCEHTHNVGICPRCQQITNRYHEGKERSVRHLDIFGKKAIIHYEHRRFYCKNCGKPFTENLQWIDNNRRQTKEYEKNIYRKVKNKTTIKEVAKQEGLDESTVREIFKKYAKKETMNPRRKKLRILGIDEISLRKGHKSYVLVLSDVERRYVIEVLPDRKKETLEGMLKKLTEEERKGIKIVTIDMWVPYREAIKKLLKHAKIVADRFHVMKGLNHQLNLLRKALQRNGDEELKELLKGSRWILLKNRGELKPEEEEKLLLIMEKCDELRRIYLLKEEFRIICEKIKDKAKAKRFLKAWENKAIGTGNRYIKKFVNTLNNWWEEFLNYFEDRNTQGFVEGMNRAIRGIIDRAFGYHLFKNFRLQVMVECGET